MNRREWIALYREVFDDDDPLFAERLFTLCGDYCRTAREQDNPAALLFALPCTIENGKKTANGYYIYACATKKEYRGKGYMSRLLTSVIAEGKPMLLKPADSGLIRFYRRLGFQTFSVSGTEESECRALPVGGFAALARTEPVCNDKRYTAMQCNGDGILKDGLFFPFTLE